MNEEIHVICGDCKHIMIFKDTRQMVFYRITKGKNCSECNSENIKVV